jgi:hypothetical protein
MKFFAAALYFGSWFPFFGSSSPFALPEGRQRATGWVLVALCTRLSSLQSKLRH